MPAAWGPSVATLSNVSLGVIPLGVPVLAIPWVGIDLYDELPDGEPALVDVELPHGEVWVTEPADVATYQDIVGKLWSSARTGPDAVALIRSPGPESSP